MPVKHRAGRHHRRRAVWRRPQGHLRSEGGHWPLEVSSICLGQCCLTMLMLAYVNVLRLFMLILLVYVNSAYVNVCLFEQCMVM